MESFEALKTCLFCKQEKPTTDYHIDKKRHDGLNPYCKVCIAERDHYHYHKYKGNASNHPWAKKKKERVKTKLYYKVLNILDYNYWMSLDDVMYRMKWTTRVQRQVARNILHNEVEKGNAIKNNKGKSKKGNGFHWEWKRIKK